MFKKSSTQRIKRTTSGESIGTGVTYLVSVFRLPPLGRFPKCFWWICPWPLSASPCHRRSWSPDPFCPALFPERTCGTCITSTWDVSAMCKTSCNPCRPLSGKQWTRCAWYWTAPAAAALCTPPSVRFCCTSGRRATTTAVQRRYSGRGPRTSRASSAATGHHRRRSSFRSRRTRNSVWSLADARMRCCRSADGWLQPRPVPPDDGRLRSISDRPLSNR